MLCIAGNFKFSMHTSVYMVEPGDEETIGNLDGEQGTVKGGNWWRC